MTRITEQPSPHRHLEKKSIEEITEAINNEDKVVAAAIEKALPQLNQLIAAVCNKLKHNGRMFYLGAGSGGRLSVLDAIEVPTPYGIPKRMVNVILAGGVDRLADALEQMEDDATAGWLALQQVNILPNDFEIGLTASGTTPICPGRFEGAPPSSFP